MAEAHPRNGEPACPLRRIADDPFHPGAAARSGRVKRWVPPAGRSGRAQCTGPSPVAAARSGRARRTVPLVPSSQPQRPVAGVGRSAARGHSGSHPRNGSHLPHTVTLCRGDGTGAWPGARSICVAATGRGDRPPRAATGRGGIRPLRAAILGEGSGGPVRWAAKAEMEVPSVASPGRGDGRGGGQSAERRAPPSPSAERGHSLIRCVPRPRPLVTTRRTGPHVPECCGPECRARRTGPPFRRRESEWPPAANGASVPSPWSAESARGRRAPIAVADAAARG